METITSGASQLPPVEGKYRKVCLYCRKQFSSDSRNTRFCQDNEGACQQKYSKSKRSAREEYKKNAEKEKVKVLAHKLAVAVLHLNGVEKKCCICGTTEGEIEAHHINMDIFDNRLANLCWLSKKAHAEIHSRIDQEVKEQGNGVQEQGVSRMVFERVYQESRQGNTSAGGLVA